MVIYAYILLVLSVISVITNIFTKKFVGILTSLICIVYLCLTLFAGITVVALAWVWFGIAIATIVVNMFMGVKGVIMNVFVIPELVYLCIILF